MNISQITSGLIATVFVTAFSSFSQAGTEIKLVRGTILTQNFVKGIESANSHQTEWIVQFKNHVLESDKKNLLQQGFQIHSYMPEDALIVRGSSAMVTALQKQSSIQAIIPFQPGMKLSPQLGVMSSLTAPSQQTVIVSLFKADELPVVVQKIQKISSDILVQRAGGAAIVLTATRANLSIIAGIEGVESIQSFVQMQPMHFIVTNADGGTVTDTPTGPGDYSDITGYESGTRVMNFDAAWALGFSGQNQIVGISDTGFDSGDVNTIHSDFKGAVKSGAAFGLYSKSWADPMGHGTHVAGSVLGRGVVSGGKLNGGAYSAQLVAQGMWSPMLNNLSVPNDLASMLNKAYNDGARIHTNSWGAASNFGAYEKMAATVDQVMFDKQDLLILFAAGNSGVDKNRDGRIDPNSVGTPGTAKNVLTVGASENLLAKGGILKKVGELGSAKDNWPASPIADGTMSDNINGLAMFSSRGPTLDGRVKPEIVAPGTNILSVRSQQPTAEVLWGAYNKDYVYSGGTSMATPLTAGAAAVARQILIEKLNQAQPTAALVKAFLTHTAVDMFPGQFGEVGSEHGQELLTRRPNNDEGFGRVDVAQFVKFGQNGAMMVVDSKTGVATGETSEATLKVSQAGRLQVNLVWTDAPGSVNSSKALVNDLDLEVVLPNGQVVANNDQINNNAYLSVDVPAGDVVIRVKGINVPMGKSGQQPFALVASVQ